MRHAVIRPGDRDAVADPGRPDGAAGYRRAVMIDDRCGSVHMTLGFARQEAHVEETEVRRPATAG